MTFNRKIAVCLTLCITAILGIAVCGCDDLGAYEDTEEYYASFGDVVFLGGAAGSGKSYPVKDYFYNEESREDFLVGEDGVYRGVTHSDYVYVAIPFTADIEMDSLAMYVQAESDVTLYMNVYLTKILPKNWQELDDPDASASGEAFNLTTLETTASSSETAAGTPATVAEEETEKTDDPDPLSRIGEVTLRLKSGAWNSFTLDSFQINEGTIEKSIRVESGQYILLQIRNNSGVRVLDQTTGLYVDQQSGTVPDKAVFTMTNLLVRALNTDNTTETKEE